MLPPTATPPLHQTTGYVDGGAALVRSACSPTEWAQVREGWWWHLLAMVLVPPYALVALTVWQRPSGQPLGRRVAWSTLAVAGALVLVGLPAFVAFSRRWYWWHRMGASPEAVLAAPRTGGPLALRAAADGARLVDAVTGAGRRPPAPGVALPLLESPWGELRDQVAAAALRIRALQPDATGPAVVAVGRAAQEVAAAHRAAVRVADRAAHAAQANRAVDRVGLERDLAALEGAPGSAEDRDAARRSLLAQLQVADRVARALEGLEGQLRRLAAQAGEAAARAEELVWCPTRPLEDETASLEAVTDRLAAVRAALDAVGRVDVALAAG